MIGTRLSHYVLAEEIGAGGMGVVYRAHDERLDRDVAIKVLPAGTLDEIARARFRREALALSRLNHPHISMIHDDGDDRDPDPEPRPHGHAPLHGARAAPGKAGERETAFAWLERALKERSHWLVAVRVDSRFDSLREEPRFEDLLKKMGVTA